VRRLAQPEVLKSAGLAALVTALLCYPRLALWSTRALPIWYLEATLFFGGIVLWAFIFAWHTEYSKRPVLAPRLEPVVFALVTLAGIIVVCVQHQFFDPTLRARTPADYPDDLAQWTAMTLFSLAFTQVYLVFAPFAWLMRLFRNPKVAIALTVLFGVIVLLIKNRSAPLPPPWLAILLVARAFLGWLSVLFYLRGGILLASWWTFLLHIRYLLELPGGP
jgi:hypothetical protein